MPVTKIKLPLLAEESIDTITATSHEVAESPNENAHRAAPGKTLTLAGAMRNFISADMQARNAQISSQHAGDGFTTLIKKFCAYLVRNDFDAKIVVGQTFLKRFVNACPQIHEKIKEIGEPNVAHNMQHPVVQVNGIVLDLCFLRLGTQYSGLNNFPYREFTKFFKEVKDVKHLMAITPEQAAHMMRMQKFAAAPKPPSQQTSDDLWWTESGAKPEYKTHWFIYKGKDAIPFKTTSGERVTLVKGAYFGVRENTASTDLVVLSDHPDLVIRLTIAKSDDLTAKGKPVKAPPASAIRSPKKIQIPMTAKAKKQRLAVLPKPVQQQRSGHHEDYDDAQPVTSLRGRIPVIDFEADDDLSGLDIPALGRR